MASCVLCVIFVEGRQCLMNFHRSFVAHWFRSVPLKPISGSVCLVRTPFLKLESLGFDSWLMLNTLEALRCLFWSNNLDLLVETLKSQILFVRGASSMEAIFGFYHRMVLVFSLVSNQLHMVEKKVSLGLLLPLIVTHFEWYMQTDQNRHVVFVVLLSGSDTGEYNQRSCFCRYPVNSIHLMVVGIWVG